jgi:hypothetical protein
MPWVKSRLTLNHITDATVQRLTESSPDRQSLFSCEAIVGGSRFMVTSQDGLRLRLTLEQLSGQFADIGKPIDSL